MAVYLEDRSVFVLQLNAYYDFMKSYAEMMEEIAAGESEKYAAVLSYDHKKMDKAVSNQQVNNIRIAKMEEERLQEQQKAGFDGLTFAEILEKLNEDDKQRFSELFSRIKNAVYDIKYFNSKSLAFAQDGLKIIGNANKAQTKVTSYGKDGKFTDVRAASVFEKKI